MKLVLGVTGGVAAALIPGWVLYLRQIRGWHVQLLLTEGATHFVAPTALAAISGHPVHVGRTWMAAGEALHKELTFDADILAVSPCTVNTFAKLGAGIADDIVTLTAAFSSCPVLLFPAFSDREIGKLWEKLSTDVLKAGYHLSTSQVPARRTVDGGTTQSQGFPTIEIFEREIQRVLT